MNTDREFDIALADIDAENTRLIHEFLRSHRRKRDESLAGLPQPPKQPVMRPAEVEAEEGIGHED